MDDFLLTYLYICICVMVQFQKFNSLHHICKIRIEDWVNYQGYNKDKNRMMKTRMPE